MLWYKKAWKIISFEYFLRENIMEKNRTPKKTREFFIIILCNWMEFTIYLDTLGQLTLLKQWFS